MNYLEEYKKKNKMSEQEKIKIKIDNIIKDNNLSIL